MKYVFLINAFFVCLSPVSSQADTGIYLFKEDILYKEEADVSPYENERCRLDIYYPEHLRDFVTVIWFHGGGLRGGEKYLPDQLKEKNIAVVTANYRLFPEVKCPEYIEDAAAAVAWVFRHIREYGGDPGKIIVSGHSAGGYLASMVGLDTSYLAKHGLNANDLAALVPFSGHAITHFTVREERGVPGTQVIADHYAPIYHVRPDAPPYIIITGDRNLELLGRYEENAFMWRMMQEAGHRQVKVYEMDGYNHGAMPAPAFHILLQECKKLK